MGMSACLSAPGPCFKVAAPPLSTPPSTGAASSTWVAPAPPPSTPPSTGAAASARPASSATTYYYNFDLSSPFTGNYCAAYDSGNIMQKRCTAGNVYGTAADKAAAHRSGSSASLGQGISSEGANGSNPAYTIHYTRPVASHSEGINSYIQHDPPVLQEVFLLTVFQMVNGSADGYNAPELAYEISAIKAVSTGTVYTTAAYDNDNSVSKKLMKNDNERSPAADNCGKSLF